MTDGLAGQSARKGDARHIRADVAHIPGPSNHMSLRSRSRWLAAASAVAIPALALSMACSTDKAAGPAAAATADTVGLDEGSTTFIERWGQPVNGDSGYATFNAMNLIESDLDGSGDYQNSRLLIQYALPKLAGKGVVDSAKMYNYVCSNNGNVFTDSVVVDHVDWGAAYQDSASWGDQTLQANIGTLVRDTTTGWRSVDVTSSIQADYVAKRAATQYRLEFDFSTMPLGDRAVWLGGGGCGGNTGSGGQAYIVIWAH